jgi:histidinol dehydrogenase
MRILTLSKETEARVFRARESEDRAALEAANKIVGDVRRRGDRALFQWAKRLDGVDLARQQAMCAGLPNANCRGNGRCG